VPTRRGWNSLAVPLFAECTGRILFEVAPDKAAALQAAFADEPLAVIGHTTAAHAQIRVSCAGRAVLARDLPALKRVWRQRLAAFY